MTRLAIFDVNGTLVNSQHLIVAAMQSAFKQHGLDNPAAERIRRNIGLELVEAVAKLLPDSDEALHKRLAAAYKEAFFSLQILPEHDAPMFPGAREALSRLEADGWVLAVATGK